MVKARLRDMAYWSFHSYDPKKAKCGLSEAEFSALKDLSANKDIVIQKTDKGNSIAILDKEDYVKKIEQILADRSKFSPAKLCKWKIYNHMVNLQDKIKNFLRTLVVKNCISEEAFSKLAPIGCVPGHDTQNSVPLMPNPLCNWDSSAVPQTMNGL